MKLPKTFLAVNLSDAFTFEEAEKPSVDSDGLEMKITPPRDLLTEMAPMPSAPPESSTTAEVAEAAEVDEETPTQTPMA